MAPKCPHAGSTVPSMLAPLEKNQCMTSQLSSKQVDRYAELCLLVQPTEIVPVIVMLLCMGDIEDVLEQDKESASPLDLNGTTDLDDNSAPQRRRPALHGRDIAECSTQQSAGSFS